MYIKLRMLNFVYTEKICTVIFDNMQYNTVSLQYQITMKQIYSIKMTTATKPDKTQFNQRGRINALDTGASIRVSRTLGYKQSYVRSVSSVLSADMGNNFSVNLKDKVIIVSRTA